MFGINSREHDYRHIDRAVHPNLLAVQMTSAAFPIAHPAAAHQGFPRRTPRPPRIQGLLTRAIEAASRLFLRARLNGHGTRCTGRRGGSPSTATQPSTFPFISEHGHGT